LIFAGASCAFVDATVSPRMPYRDVPQHETAPALSIAHVAPSPADTLTAPVTLGAFIGFGIHGGLGGRPHAPRRHCPQHVIVPSACVPQPWIMPTPIDVVPVRSGLPASGFARALSSR